MKRRHAAALALVGWYLMLPPVKQGTIHTEAPLGKWEVNEAFESAERCNQGRKSNLNDAVQQLKNPASDALDRITAMDFLKAQCIASDDPRLAK